MRRYQAVWRLKQWIILFDRLRGHHIQSGCRYFSALQRVRQILLFNQRSSGVVQDDHAILHLGNRIFIDNLLSLWEQRAMQRDNVGTFQQFIQSGISAGIGYQFRVLVGIICQHAHS